MVVATGLREGGDSGDYAGTDVQPLTVLPLGYCSVGGASASIPPRGPQQRRRWGAAGGGSLARLAAAACGLVLLLRPISPLGFQLPSRQAAWRVRGGLRSLRRIPLAAAGDAGWSPEEETAIMDEVLGRSTMEGGDEELVVETRLLREQAAELIQELRLLRGVLNGEEPAIEPDVEPVAAPAPTPAARVAAPEAPAPAPQSSQPPAVQAPSSPPAPIEDRMSPAPAPATSPMPAPAAETQPTPAAEAPSAPKTGKTKIKVVSSGHDSGNIADFFVDETQVPVSGQSYRRGLNVVVIDPAPPGRVLTAKTYDIWGSPIDENRRFAADVKALPEGRVVLVALKDSGMENCDGGTLAALRSLGADIERPLAARESYVLIGEKDGDAFVEKQGMRTLLVEYTLPYPVQAPLARPRAPSTPASRPPAYSAPSSPGGAGSTAGAPASAAASSFQPPRPPPVQTRPPPPSRMPPVPPPPPSRMASMPPPPKSRVSGATPTQQAEVPPPAPEATPRPSPPPRPARPTTGPAAVPSATSVGVDFASASAAAATEEAKEGESWEEVVSMLERLQKRIEEKKAQR